MEALWLSLAGGIGIFIGGLCGCVSSIAKKDHFKSKCFGCCNVEYDSDDENNDEDE